MRFKHLACIILSMCAVGCAGVRNPQIITGEGFGESRLRQVAIEEATLVARNSIVTQIEVRMQSYTSRFVTETGVGRDSDTMRRLDGLIKAVASMTLRDSRVVSQEHREKGEGYEARVRVEYWDKEATKEVVKGIDEDQLMRTNFERTKVLAEMREEIRKYEEWKRKNNLEY